MTTQTVLLVLVGYMAAMYAISRAARGRGGSFQQTIAAPRQTPVLLLMASAIGGQIGSGFVMGGAEYGVRYGLSGAWYGIGCGVSYFVTAALAGFIHRRQMVSLSDYFAQRYSGLAPRLIYSVTGSISAVALLAGQLLAGKAVFSTVGLPEQWGVAVTAVAALLYANRAGLWGMMAVSPVHTTTIFLGMSAALAFFFWEEGAVLLTQSLPQEQFQPFSCGGEQIFSMAGPIVLASAVNQIAFQSVTSAKTAETARIGYLAAGVLLIPIAFIPPVIGMFGHVLLGEIPAEQVFTALLLGRLPAAVAGVILAAILCAVMTSCNGAYIAVGTNVVHDIYKGILHPQADSETCRRLMFLVDAAVCAVGILLALAMNDIIQVLSMGYSLMAAGCLVPFLGGMAWKWGTGRDALVSAVVGMGAYLAHAAGLVELPYASLSAILCSAGAYVLSALVRRWLEKRTSGA